MVVFKISSDTNENSKYKKKDKMHIIRLFGTLYWDFTIVELKKKQYSVANIMISLYEF